jgi:uridylate kinase
MINIDKKKYIISLGGSLICPPEGIDIEFLCEFDKFIREKVKEGNKFFITCGGGITSRNYINAATNVIGVGLKDFDKDWLGIHSTRLNGHLMRTIFRDIAYDHLIHDYSIINKEAIKFPIVISVGWKPGWSTDYCATLIAEDYGSNIVINLSNIDQVYDKDPKKNEDAKPINTMTWSELQNLVGNEWTPGMNTPFDPVATKKASEINLKVIIANGKNLQNLDKIISGKNYIGTTIHN